MRTAWNPAEIRSRTTLGTAAAALVLSVASLSGLTACSSGSPSSAPPTEPAFATGPFPVHGAATGSVTPFPPGGGGPTGTVGSPPGPVPATTSVAPATPSPELSASAQPLPVRSPAPAPPGVPAAGEVNRADAVATARAAVVTMWASDTTTDAGEREASLRAAPYLTPEFAAQLRRDPPVAGPGAEWREWAAHRAYVSVTVELADEMGRPPDTTNTSVHTLQVTATPVGRDGWKGTPLTQTVMISLSRADGAPWAVTYLQVRM
ncbi:hypothetical protein [Streptodolium elevatio]|uniref:Uncharacterized protein n=1 Tax=Streptodolium elevatio TaxID=3157996 RepID=A0ABV3DCY9_9ACTN